MTQLSIFFSSLLTFYSCNRGVCEFDLTFMKLFSMPRFFPHSSVDITLVAEFVSRRLKQINLGERKNRQLSFFIVLTKPYEKSINLYKRQLLIKTLQINKNRLYETRFLCLNRKKQVLLQGRPKMTSRNFLQCLFPPSFLSCFFY